MELEVSRLDVSYRVRRNWLRVVRDVSFHVDSGGSYGLVGESGCGKTTVASAVVRLLATNGRVNAGSVRVQGIDVFGLGAASLRKLRANHVGMVPQDPVAALNPSKRVGTQVAEAFEVLGDDRETALDRVREELARVQLRDVGRVIRRYPHELSGGTAQRVVLAMALASRPSLLILDEPTTGLDATVQAEILNLVDDMRKQMGTSVLWISHNLEVVRRMCDRVGVLYDGRLVEEGPTDEVFASPHHPYTVGLMRCIPRRGATKRDRLLDTIPGSPPGIATNLGGCAFVNRCAMATAVCIADEPQLIAVGEDRASRCHHHGRASELPRSEPVQIEHRERSAGEPLLRLRRVSKSFETDGRPFAALRDVSLTIRSGETLGLVGESGSGKTTLAKAIVGLHAADPGGVVELAGVELGELASSRSDQQVSEIQIVFQNPDSALNPSWSVRGIIARAVRQLAQLPRRQARQRAAEIARSVQLSDRHLDARPIQLSGGLKQRVAVARAFAGNPRLVVCDEPTSALDVSVQAVILNLLADLQNTRDVAYLFISHDLAVVRYLSDRIAVMYLGEVVEHGSAAEVFDGPHHPYTEVLLSAAAYLYGETDRRIRLVGELPSASEVPSGCPFHTRCPRAFDRCRDDRPPLVEPHPGHEVRCHLPVDQLGRADGSVALPPA